MAADTATPDALSAGRAAPRVAAGQTARADPAGKLDTLRALRGICCVLVVLFHVNHSIFGPDGHYFPGQPFGNTFEFGYAGILVFFVLSGFIIATVHTGDIGRPGRWLPFVKKRVKRVYPMYWFALLTVVPIYFIFPTFGTGQERSLGGLLDSFTLMHIFGGAPVLVVSWTLFYEILFYGLFSLLIIDLRLGAACLVLWFVGSALHISQPSAGADRIDFHLSHLNLLFALGIGGAFFSRRLKCPAPWLVALGGVSLFLATAAIDNAGRVMFTRPLYAPYGIASILMIVGFVELERLGKLSFPGTLLLLGDASYSIYLIHFSALSVLAKLARLALVHVPVPGGVIYVGLALGAVAAGLLVYRFVEAPLMLLLGKQHRAAKA